LSKVLQDCTKVRILITGSTTLLSSPSGRKSIRNPTHNDHRQVADVTHRSISTLLGSTDAPKYRLAKSCPKIPSLVCGEPSFKSLEVFRRTGLDCLLVTMPTSPFAKKVWLFTDSSLGITKLKPASLSLLEVVCLKNRCQWRRLFKRFKVFVQRGPMHWT